MATRGSKLVLTECNRRNAARRASLENAKNRSAGIVGAMVQKGTRVPQDMLDDATSPVKDPSPTPKTRTRNYPMPERRRLPNGKVMTQRDVVMQKSGVRVGTEHEDEDIAAVNRKAQANVAKATAEMKRRKAAEAAGEKPVPMIPMRLRNGERFNYPARGALTPEQAAKFAQYRRETYSGQSKEPAKPTVMGMNYQRLPDGTRSDMVSAGYGRVNVPAPQNIGAPVGVNLFTGNRASGDYSESRFKHHDIPAAVKTAMDQNYALNGIPHARTADTLGLPLPGTQQPQQQQAAASQQPATWDPMQIEKESFNAIADRGLTTGQVFYPEQPGQGGVANVMTGQPLPLSAQPQAQPQRQTWDMAGVGSQYPGEPDGSPPRAPVVRPTLPANDPTAGLSLAERSLRDTPPLPLHVWPTPPQPPVSAQSPVAPAPAAPMVAGMLAGGVPTNSAPDPIYYPPSVQLDLGMVPHWPSAMAMSQDLPPAQGVQPPLKLPASNATTPVQSPTSQPHYGNDGLRVMPNGSEWLTSLSPESIAIMGGGTSATPGPAQRSGPTPITPPPTVGGMFRRVGNALGRGMFNGGATPPPTVGGMFRRVGNALGRGMFNGGATPPAEPQAPFTPVAAEGEGFFGMQWPWGRQPSPVPPATAAPTASAPPEQPPVQQPTPPPAQQPATFQPVGFSPRPKPINVPSAEQIAQWTEQANAPMHSQRPGGNDNGGIPAVKTPAQQQADLAREQFNVQKKMADEAKNDPYSESNQAKIAQRIAGVVGNNDRIGKQWVSMSRKDLGAMQEKLESFERLMQSETNPAMRKAMAVAIRNSGVVKSLRDAVDSQTDESVIERLVGTPNTVMTPTYKRIAKQIIFRINQEADRKLKKGK